jgi:hypothetical protein
MRLRGRFRRVLYRPLVWRYRRSFERIRAAQSELEGALLTPGMTNDRLAHAARTARLRWPENPPREGVALLEALVHLEEVARSGEDFYAAGREYALALDDLDVATRALRRAARNADE